VLAFGLSLCCAATTQEQQAPEPPEEDESLAVKEYSFNPLQAEKELKIGNFYFKKGNYKAAAGRFLEATRWNENFAEAWRRLGDAYGKLKDDKGARDAYARYLALEPAGKQAAAIRKRLEGPRGK